MMRHWGQVIGGRPKKSILACGAQEHKDSAATLSSDLPPGCHETPPERGDRLFTGLPPVEEIERYSRPRSTRPQPPAISALTWAIATGHSHAFW